VIINVTQSNIDNGTPKDLTSCPIAIALYNQTGDRWSVGTLTYWQWNRSERKKLPREAVQFVASFDSKGKGGVEPFSFEVDIE
jgi:hypothetical protein